MTLWTSHAPSGEWFVFDDDGRTVRKGFKTRVMAVAWAYQRMFIPMRGE